MKSRLLIISFASLLMLGLIWIMGLSIREDRKDLSADGPNTAISPSIPIERGPFSQAENALDYTQMPEGNRTLASTYQYRAFPGAPPSIPHPLISEEGIGGKTCLQCHEKGGYAARFQAYTPPSPHPDWLNCRQCHVAQNTPGVFRSTSWEKTDFPEIHQRAFEGAPPMIPHSLALRENCLVCHAGPAAPEEIRVSHPERINCRQCHVMAKSIHQAPLEPGFKPDSFSRTLGIQGREKESTQVSRIDHWVHQQNAISLKK